MGSICIYFVNCKTFKNKIQQLKTKTMAKALKMEVLTMEVKPSVKKQVISIEQKALELQEWLKTALKRTKWLSASQKLSFLGGINRPIGPNQVTKLAKSIMLIGCIRPIVVARLSFISGKMETYIIDGQHTFTSLIRIGWPIPYIEIDIKDKQDLVEKIALLNASSKTWSMFDYITAWASLKEDYVKLNRYFQIYDFELSVLAGVLNETNTSSSADRIKKGEFRILNEQRNVEILNHLTDALNIVPRMNRFENKYFCLEFINYLRTEGSYYNHKKTMEFLKNNIDKFILATQEIGKIQEMLKNIK